MNSLRIFEIRDELSVHDGVIFKGQRCIILQTLKQKIKQKLHYSLIGSKAVYIEHGRQYTGQAEMLKSLTTSRNATSECHFRVTRLKDHLSVMSPHQGHGGKLPLTSSHLMTRIISAQ